MLTFADAGPLFDDILQRFPPQNETYDIKSGPKTLRGKIHDRIIDKRVNTLLKDIDEFVAGDGLSTTAGQSRKRTHTQRDEYLDSQYGSASSSSKRRAQGNGISTPQNASQTRVGFPSLHNGGTGGAQNGLHRGNNPLNAPQHNFPLLGQASYSVPPSNNFVPNPASNGPPNAPQPSFPPAGQASYPAPAPSNFSMKPGTARSFRDYGEYIVHNHGQELNYGTALKMQEGLAALAKLSYSTIAKMMEKRYGGYSKDQPLSSVLCPAFEANGYCPDGPSCPYTHGDTLTVPPPYVPYNPTAVPYDPTAPPPPLGAEIWEIKSNKSNKPGKQYKQYKQHKQHKQQKANKPRTKPWDNLSYDRDATLAKIAEDQKKHEQRKKKEEIEQALKENINERMNLRSKMRDLGYDPGDDPEVVKAMKEKVARLEAQVAKEEAAANGYYHYEEEIVPSGSYISNSSWVWRPDDGKHAGGEEHAPSGSYVSKSTWVWRPEQGENRSDHEQNDH